VDARAATLETQAAMAAKVLAENRMVDFVEVRKIIADLPHHVFFPHLHT
jgi:hypothetical protein